jgi:hypothetical protein
LLHCHQAVTVGDRGGGWWNRLKVDDPKGIAGSKEKKQGVATSSNPKMGHEEE